VRRLERLEGHALPADLPVVTFEDEFAAIEAAGADAAELPATAIDEDDPFLILFTSGTTGRPKGVLISHRSNIHFILSSSLRGMEQFMRATELGLESRQMAGQPKIISGSPMFHISGLNCQLVMAAASGMTIIYPPPGRWDEIQHMELTAQHGATMWSLVPTQLWRVLNSPEIGRYDLSSLMSVGGGSAVWPPEILKRTGELIPNARLEIFDCGHLFLLTRLERSAATVARFLLEDQPATAGPGAGAHHARQPYQPERPGGGGGAPPLRLPCFPHLRAAVGAPCRGAEPRPARNCLRPSLRRSRRLLEGGDGACRARLKHPRSAAA